MVRIIWTILTFGLLISCSSEEIHTPDSKLVGIKNKSNEDSVVIEQIIKPKGIDLFIDSMENSDYLLDTNRIKQTMWSVLGNHPNVVENGHQIIQLPFPVDKYEQHFTNPKTYFFAHWNETEQTFKTGNDYLLMTWTIDSSGVQNEKEIYKSLHEFMGNFPCYIFRSGNTVYAMSHRMTVAATNTRELTERLRNFVDSNAILYRPFGGTEPK